MAAQRRTTGLLRILLMTGGLILLLSMLGHARPGHDEALVSRLGNAAAALMAYPDFERAEAAENRLILRYGTGESDELTGDAGLPALLADGTIRHIWKTGGDVYFVLGGAVAEVWEGYVFSRDATLTMPVGIRTVERVEKPVTGYCCYHLATRR